MADKASIPIPGSKSSIETCRICEMRPRYDHGYGFDFGICSVCAEAVANSYCYTHSGKWLTRPNAAAVPPRPPMPADLRWSVLRDDNFTCQKCGATDRPLHVDHILALAKGGRNDRKNLQTLCDRCNTSKGAR